MLKFNPNQKCFILESNDHEKAERVGLTKSNKIFSSRGEQIWFTADYDQKPINNPYAALPFWDEADSTTRVMLQDLQRDFEHSRAIGWDVNYPRPRGKEYLPFQKAGISYALNKKNCLIGDEPGLGKTVMAIGVANAIKARKVLVICPATIRLNWQREIREWSTIPRVSTYPILKGKDGVNPYANYTILSYDLARNKEIHEVLCGMEWDLLILDEVHFLKTIEAKRTRAVFGGGEFKLNHLSNRSERIIGLTGTPLPNRPRECYTIARALCWEAIDWESYEKFCFRYNPSSTTYTGHVLEMRGRLPELQARLRTNFMIRRLKEDVLKDLPDKRYEFTYVESNGAIQEVLAKEKMIDFKIEDLKDPFGDIWGQIATIRREMGEAKVPRVIEHMKYLLDIVEIPKVVIFSHHKNVMNELTEKLKKYGIVSVRGGVGPTRKQEAVNDFVNNPNVRIFLGQLDAAGFGIDGLQKVCNHVVFAEPAWTPGTNEQCVDRIHRILQHDNVIAQFLIVEGSFDEKVLAAVLQKTHVIHDTLDRGH